MGGSYGYCFLFFFFSLLSLFYIDSLASFHTLTVLAQIYMSNLPRIRVGVVSLDLFSPIFDLMSQGRCNPHANKSPLCVVVGSSLSALELEEAYQNIPLGFSRYVTF